MTIDIFSEKKKKEKLSFNLGFLMGKPLKTGEVGIEIEVEGKNIPLQDVTPAPWLYKPDHSLRGHENGEYVLAEPIPFKAVPGALKRLWTVFRKKKTEFDDSNRTSVHVHLNCQNFHLNRLTSFMALYVISEELLTRWCGEHREGNLFCLRVKDAPAILRHMQQFIQQDGNTRVSDGMHYAGLSIHSLPRFGSIEIRTLRGCSDPETIETWVSLLEQLYKKSESYPDPRDICGLFSCLGPLAFFDEIFEDKASLLKEGLGFTQEQIETSLFEGIRHAQDICYCRDWTEYKNMNLQPDPFGRDNRQILKKLVSDNEDESSDHEIAGLEAELMVPSYDDEYPEDPDFNPPSW